MATLVGVLAALLSLAQSCADVAPPQFEVTLTPSVGGVLQVFYDRGGGFTAADSAAVAFGPTDTAQTVRLALPFGRYTQLRIDPNSVGGRYVLHRLRIVDSDSADVAILPLDQIRAARQATLGQDATLSLVVMVPAGANDPQLLYRPATPLVLAPARPDYFRAARWSAGAFLLVLVPLVLLERSASARRRFGRIRIDADTHPVRAAMLAGIAGGLLATYPLLVGQSLVSPAIGPSSMLYDGPPYSHGYDAPAPEHGRGTDTGAMMWQNIPYTAVQRAALAAGEAPLWNRYNSIGEPLWGQGQTFMLDPFHLGSLAIRDVALAMDLRFVVGRMVFAAGTGAMVVAASGSWQAGALLGFVAPFIGYFTMRFNHPAHFSIIYTPWILWAYLVLGSSPLERRWAAAAGIAVSTVLQMVGSTPKEGIVALLAAHGAGVLSLLLARSSWNERLGRLDAALLGSVCALLLAAPHWLIFLDTLSRTATLYDQPKVFLAGASQAMAYALGAAKPGVPETGVHALAVLAAALIAISPVQLWRSGPALGALIAVGTFAAIAFGATPGDWLLRLPLLGAIHHVGNTFLTATLTPLLLLGGMGVAWTHARRTRAPLAVILTASGGVVLCLAVPGAMRDLGTLLAWLTIVAAAFVLVAVAAGWTPTLSSVLATALCAYVSVAPGGLHLRTGIGQVDALLIQPPARARLDAPSPAIDAMRAHGGVDPFRVVPLEWVLFPGSQALWHLESTGGADALKLPAIDTLADLTGVERTSWLWRSIFHPGTVDGVRGFLDMTNVRFLVARRDQVPPGALPVPMSGVDQLVVVRRDSAWPRAFVVDGVERHTSVTTLAERIRRGGGPFASVSSFDEALVEALPLSASSVHAAHAYHLTPNSTTFTVDSKGPGLAVLSEAYVAAEFEATLNGRPTPYLQVNHALKGVVIPGAGSWTVRFTYQPRLWQLSWTLAAIGALMLAALVLARRLLR